jgi:hypothetical protein
MARPVLNNRVLALVRACVLVCILDSRWGQRRRPCASPDAGVHRAAEQPRGMQGPEGGVVQDTVRGHHGSYYLPVHIMQRIGTRSLFVFDGLNCVAGGGWLALLHSGLQMPSPSLMQVDFFA